ncbi:MAG: hypothetical protein PHO86_05840 [Bacilli bacterium]|nr:hypothetical protein [Bacilli bacterium]
MIKHRFIAIFFIICTALLLSGCVEKEIPEGTKKIVGLTIVESNNPLENLEGISSIDNIPITGFYLSDDYSEISFLGESLFDYKFEYSYLEGDIITPDSICAFIDGTYYQSKSTSLPIYVYEIYKNIDGTFELNLKNQITNMSGDNVLNITNEVTINSYNYVLTYLIDITKLNTPLENVIRQFNDKNQLIKSTLITPDMTIVTTEESTEYIIIEEKSVDENDEEIVKRTLLTKDTVKKYYTFKILNDESKVKSILIRFEFND